MYRISLAATCVVALTACAAGTDDDGDRAPSGSLEDVAVSEGDDPTVEIEDLILEEPDQLVVTEGEGDPVEIGDALSINILTVNGTTGEELESSFRQEEAPEVVLDEQGLRPELLEAIEDQNVGSRILVGVPVAEDDLLSGGGGALSEGDTFVFLIDLVEKVERPDPLPAAEGTEQDLPDSVPTIEFEGGEPTEFSAGSEVPATIDAPSAHVAIRGEGEQVTAGQTVTVHYHGQIYPNGDVFDSSWGRGEPAEFAIGVGQVVPCWDEGIVGQSVGSRLILVCSADSAYGDQGSPPDIDPGDSLVFVVDLLAAY